MKRGIEIVTKNMGTDLFWDALSKALSGALPARDTVPTRAVRPPSATTVSRVLFSASRPLSRVPLGSMRAALTFALLHSVHAATMMFDDITFGGGGYTSETGWSLACYAGDPASSAKLPITYAYDGGTNKTSTDVNDVQQGSSFAAGKLVLSMEDKVTSCVLTMTDSWGDGWGGNTFESPSMGVPTVGITLASGSSGSAQVCATVAHIEPHAHAHDGCPGDLIHMSLGPRVR